MANNPTYTTITYTDGNTSTITVSDGDLAQSDLTSNLSSGKSITDISSVVIGTDVSSICVDSFNTSLVHCHW